MAFHDSLKNSKKEEIDLMVYVFTRPNLRSDDMMTHIGYGFIENCFDGLKVDSKTESMHLEYPERWCNILEQRQLVKRIVDFYPNIKKVTMKTHSVYIIQCTQACQVGICDKNGDYPEREQSQQTRYCPLPHQQEGLQIFGH